MCSVSTFAYNDRKLQLFREHVCMKQTLTMLLDESRGWGSKQPTPLGTIVPIETPFLHLRSRLVPVVDFIQRPNLMFDLQLLRVAVLGLCSSTQASFNLAATLVDIIRRNDSSRRHRLVSDSHANDLADEVSENNHDEWLKRWEAEHLLKV